MNGDDEIEAALAARLARERLRKLPKLSSGPRDVRPPRRDRWLPWHFREDGRGDGRDETRPGGDLGGPD